MASKTPIQSFQQIFRSRIRCCHSNTSKVSRNGRQFSVTTRIRSDGEGYAERPRWSYTPPQMQAPFSVRERNPMKAWRCNEDPAKLDAMYNSLFGRGGDKILSDEVKWLAITHKSFDQGRRGYNDRLAYFGKRILLLQVTFRIINTGAKSNLGDANEPIQPAQLDQFGRQPFDDPALNGLEKASAARVNDILSIERTSQIAQSYGVGAVTRWKPRNPQNMSESGMDAVFSSSLFAIVGALSLTKGGEAANEFVRSKILPQLGI